MNQEVEQESEVTLADIEAAEKEPVAETPEAASEPEKPEDKEPPKPEKTVPLAALHEERERRKQFQRDLEQMRNETAQRQALLEQRLAAIQQAAYQAQQPKAPSFDDDPVSALKHETEMTRAQIAEMQAYHRQEWERQQAAAQQQQYLRQIEARVSEDVREFVAEHPDYMDAYQDLKGKRVKQYVALGYPEAHAVQMVNQEEYGLAEAAMRNGRSPAQAVYEMALTYGYTKKEAQQAANQQQKIETLQKGAKAAASLGSGGQPAGKVTLDALADMPEEDFAEFMKSGKWASLG